MNTLINCPASKQWERIGSNKHLGINIPLFSLHSKESCGIGEFNDIIPLISWCKELGFDVIQLLPLNDTGPEPSPYSALSAFALNPIHLSLASLPHLGDFPVLKNTLVSMQKLTDSQRCDYARVRMSKKGFLRDYCKSVAPLILKTADFKNFKEVNPWLEGYALFKTLRIEHEWCSWETWEPELRDPSPTTYAELVEKHKEEIAGHMMIQYLCFKQLDEVKRLANAKGVFLMGDIPILINRDSADVWLHRHLFNLDFSAGAPPDMYAEDGQTWGFPIYNWDALAGEDYAWWKERLRAASILYDIYRIDHIVGFFRIWAIPLGEHGKNGQHIPENPDLWIPQGEKILRMMIEGSPMLAIGEDLGNVPLEARACMNRLGICGTKVMRWERMWDQDKRFINPQDYPKMSMTTVSTHDSETLQQWWKAHPQEAQDYARYKNWNYASDMTHQQLFDILQSSNHTNSLFRINLLNEYLALIPGMTWPNIEDERINVPGVISDHNWTYRFRPSVEEITTNEELKQAIQGAVH